MGAWRDRAEENAFSIALRRTRQRREGACASKPYTTPARTITWEPEENALIVALLKAWKEGREATEAIDPSVFADGISTEERIRIIKELAESVNAMQAVLKLVA